MDRGGRNGVQLHSAELSKSDLKIYGSVNKAFWALEGFSGIKFNSDADVHTICFRFLMCDSQYCNWGFSCLWRLQWKEALSSERGSEPKLHTIRWWWQPCCRTMVMKLNAPASACRIRAFMCLNWNVNCEVFVPVEIPVQSVVFSQTAGTAHRLLALINRRGLGGVSEDS